MLLLNKVVSTKAGRTVVSDFPAALPFEVPEALTRAHTWDKSAEIIGNRLVILQAEQTAKTFRVFSVDLNPIIANSGHDVIWTEEVIDVKIMMGRSMRTLQWLDAQRVRRMRTHFDNFAPYDAESDDADDEVAPGDARDDDVIREEAGDGVIYSDESYDDDEIEYLEDSEEDEESEEEEFSSHPPDTNTAEHYMSSLNVKITL